MRLLSPRTVNLIQNTNCKLINAESNITYNITPQCGLLYYARHNVTHAVVSDSHIFDFRQVGFWVDKILRPVMEAELVSRLNGIRNQHEEFEIELPLLKMDSNAKYKWDADNEEHSQTYRVVIEQNGYNDVRCDFFRFSADMQEAQLMFSVYPLYDLRGGVEEIVVSKAVAAKFSEYLSGLKQSILKRQQEATEEGIVTDDNDPYFDKEKAEVFKYYAMLVLTIDVMIGKLKGKGCQFSQKERSVLDMLDTTLQKALKTSKVRQDVAPMLFAKQFPLYPAVRQLLDKIKANINNLGEVYAKVA